MAGWFPACHKKLRRSTGRLRPADSAVDKRNEKRNELESSADKRNEKRKILEARGHPRGISKNPSNEGGMMLNAFPEGLASREAKLYLRFCCFSLLYFLHFAMNGV